MLIFVKHLSIRNFIIFLFISFTSGDDRNQPNSSAQNTYIELDILQALNVSNEMRGVKEFVTEDGHKAWRFHSAFDHVQIPPNTTYQFLEHLVDQLSLSIVYKQHRKTVAALVSFNSPGKMSPWLRFVSDTKRNKLLIDYRIIEDNKLHEKKFDLMKCKMKKGDKLHNWSRVFVSLNKRTLLVRLGCRNESLSDIQQLAGHVYLKFPLDSLIYFRQEPGFKKKLLGAVSEAKLTNFARSSKSDCV